MRAIDNYIKAAAKRHNTTLKAVSAALGMSYMGLISHANGNPSIDTLRRIANAIGDGCTTAELVTPPDVWERRTSPLRCPHCGKPIDITLH